MRIAHNENVLLDIQFGFRPKHSFFHQLYQTLRQWKLKTKKYGSEIFLDIAQAFNTVLHNELLFKFQTQKTIPSSISNLS